MEENSQPWLVEISIRNQIQDRQWLTKGLVGKWGEENWRWHHQVGTVEEGCIDGVQDRQHRKWRSSWKLEGETNQSPEGGAQQTLHRWDEKPRQDGQETDPTSSDRPEDIKDVGRVCGLPPKSIASGHKLREDRQHLRRRAPRVVEACTTGKFGQDGGTPHGGQRKLGVQVPPDCGAMGIVGWRGSWPWCSSTRVHEKGSTAGNGGTDPPEWSVSRSFGFRGDQYWPGRGVRGVEIPPQLRVSTVPTWRGHVGDQQVRREELCQTGHVAMDQRRARGNGHGVKDGLDPQAEGRRECQKKNHLGHEEELRELKSQDGRKNSVATPYRRSPHAARHVETSRRRQRSQSPRKKTTLRSTS